MKLLPLIGALLLSASPVQAIETSEELMRACLSTDEMKNVCAGAGDFTAAAAIVSTLCNLEEKGRITKENAVLTWDEWKDVSAFLDDGLNLKPMVNEGAEYMLENFPECSLNP
ncbi:hypothetical protein [Synechococcus sp. CC9616]|uniref:hypothetical protein n=1 Tax=Synechococcus sp. CC9616 TaxID=110663 RepID=UPI0012EBACB4|nr:hypothetical protein [Synechococcus sp. CC9616]